MKNNNELDFNFNNTPFSPVDAQSKRKIVDRIGKKKPEPAQKKDVDASKISAHRSHVAPSTMLTADEIMHMNDGDRKKPEVAPEKIPMTSVKREAPSEKAEPTAAEGGYSNAALEIMRRMQKAESGKTEKKIEATSVVEEKKTEVEVEVKTAVEEKKAEPIKIEPISMEAKTEIDAIAKREIKAESFELDRSKMDEGIQELEEEYIRIYGNKDESDIEVAPADELIDENAGTITFEVAKEAVKLPEIEAAYDDSYTDDEDEEGLFIDEYNGVEDAQSVTQDLISRKRRLSFRLFATASIAFLLILVTCVKDLFPFGQPIYFIAVGSLLALATLANITTFSSLISVFTLKNDSDFAPAFAMLAAAIQTACAAFLGTAGMTYTSIFAAAAVLSLTANTLSKRLTVSRTLANFELIANEEPKQAADFIPPPKSALIADESEIGQSLILGRRSTIDLKGFISYSLSPDFYERISGKFSLVILLGSLISFAAALLTGNTLNVSISMFAATACAAAQIAFIYPGAVQLSHSCRKLRQHKVVLSGIRAAEEINEANVIVLDSNELFFDECVSLYQFPTFSGFAPDEAFMTAHALAQAAHSPLAGVFGRICATQNCGMYKADSVVYENSMGITGWVEERKTLLGNRMIMESHSIPVPSMEIDRKILKNGQFPVYLAIDNKIAALFTVDYAPDKHMLHRIRRLINTGVTVLVRTVDPNVTADLICDRYGLPTESLMVMESNASRIYSQAMQKSESTTAVLSAPNADGFVDAYVESYAISRRNKIASIAVLVLACIMMALTVIMPAIGMASAVNILTSFISHAVTFVITAIIMAFLG